VGRRLGVDVTEGDDTLPVQHYRGGDLPGSDPAEQAVWHNSIIVAGGHLRRRTTHQSPAGAWTAAAFSADYRKFRLP